MSYRTILAPAAYEKPAALTLEAAFRVAKIFNSHVNAMHVRLDPSGPMPYVAGPMPTELLVQISENAEQMAAARSEAVRKVFDAAVAKAGVKVVDKAARGATPSAAWIETMGNLDYRYGVAGRVHDISVVPRPGADDMENTVDIMEGLLFSSGRPVLMVPPEPFATIGQTVVVAWKPGVEAARAVAAAMPFLEQAKRVVIITVNQQADEVPSAQDLANSLAWHGIQADLMDTKESGLSDGKTILKAAVAVGGDLLVMGAYSHSRLRELILGGVTQDVIAEAKMPILLCH